jgi:hypothetical protein
MNWFGSGFVTIIIYGLFSESPIQDNAILTENNLDLLTENSMELLIEN